MVAPGDRYRRVPRAHDLFYRRREPGTDLACWAQLVIVSNLAAGVLSDLPGAVTRE